MQELYQRKTGKGTLNVMCRMCGKSPELCLTYRRRVGHSLRLSISRGITQLLKSCSLRCWRTWNLFQKCLHGIQRPNPSYENGSAQALWDVPVYADSIEVRGQQNRSQNSRQSEETSVSHWNELSLVGWPRSERGLEDTEIRSTNVGIEREKPRLPSETV